MPGKDGLLHRTRAPGTPHTGSGKLDCGLPPLPSPPTMDITSAARLLEALVPILHDTGAAVMEIYASDFTVRGKVDGSPLTDADERAEAIVTPALEALLPGVPVIAEEAVATGTVPITSDRFWLVDPLDGTREFIGRNGEFTVNVALVEDGEPVLGAVLAPALGQLFLGAAGVGAFIEQDGRRKPIRCRTIPPGGLTVVASRSHSDPTALDAFLAGRKVAALVAMGSSLKLCLIAAGEADLYPRLGRSMEWDIAAGHAVLAAAGGHVRTLAGAPLRYGKPGLENPHFVASGLD